MFIRRYEAVFLVTVAAFSIPFLFHSSQTEMQLAAAASGPPNPDCKAEWVYKPGMKCQEEEKDAQGKPTGKKNGKTCPCKKTDQASGKTVPGKCESSGICHADSTAEGEKPQTCIETGKCKPGETTPPKPGGEPKMPELPKPPGGGGEGGGGQPKPNEQEKKQEEIPKPNEDPKPNGALIRSEGVPVPDREEEKSDEAKDRTDPFATDADVADRADKPKETDDNSNVADMHEQSQADATGFNDGGIGSREVREGDEVKEQTFGERAVETANNLRETAAKAYDGAKEAIISAASEAKETFSKGVENLREAFGFGGEKPLETGTGQYDVQQSENTEAGYLVNNPKETTVTMSEGFYPARDDGVIEASVEPLVEDVEPSGVAKEYAADALENAQLEQAKDVAADAIDGVQQSATPGEPKPEIIGSVDIQPLIEEVPEQTIGEQIGETIANAYETVTETVQSTAQRITNFFRRLF